ncbi:MAG: mechanosensitive ion channel [Luteitalea sp.]|nr:mechanosensitive ion channel [Luteitalea sp.]
MQDMMDRFNELLGASLPSLLGALVILIVGWLVALIAAGIVRGLLKRTDFDNRLAGWIFGGRATTMPIERYLGQIVFWIVMLFVLMAFFQALQLTVVTEPLNALLQQITSFAPRLLGVLVLLIVAAVLAAIARALVTRALTATRADERLAVEGGPPLSQTLGEAVYWIVWLLFLPNILSTLELHGLLTPIQAMLNKALAFLPNVLAAGLILAVGWFVAHLVRRIVTSLLAAIGVDRFGERHGLQQAMGGTSVSAAVGTVVYVLVLLPVAISALNALQLEAVTAPASNMLDTLLSSIPAVFGAALVILLSYVIGRVIAGLVARTLSAVGFDNLLGSLGLTAPAGAAPARKPSTIVGHLILVVILLFAAIEAAGLMGFTALQGLLASFIVLGGHIVLGLVVFGVGLYLANLASNVIRASNVTNARFLASAARVAVLVLAGAMALRQMGLANEIINIAFGLLLGAIAIAVALAFGLGARDAAGREVESWVRSVRRPE